MTQTEHILWKLVEEMARTDNFTEAKLDQAKRLIDILELDILASQAVGDNE